MQVRRKTADQHIGQKYGRLTVLSFSRRDGTQYWFNCRCDCGTERLFRIGAIRSKPHKTQSCGCLGKERRLAANLGNTYRRVSDSAARQLFSRYQNDAARRSIDFKLSFAEFVQLTSSSCWYCGSAPTAVAGRKRHTPYVYTGVDRVDNSKGYTALNTVPCCSPCNSKKNSISLAMILKIADRIRAQE